MLKIIVAASSNGVIGIKGRLPWNLRDDLKWFRDLTLNHPVVMGSVTFDSIIRRNNRPLPNRENIVLTRDRSKIRVEGVTVVDDFQKIIDRGRTEDLFIIGGAKVYRLALPFARETYLTRVLAEIEGDVYFPSLNLNEWKLLSSLHKQQDERNEFPFVWEIYRRV